MAVVELIQKEINLGKLTGEQQCSSLALIL